MAQQKNLTELFANIGQYGISAAVASDGFVYFRIPADRKLAKQPGLDPKTGQPKVYHMQASTGGWVSVPGTELRVSVNAGFRDS